MIFKIDFEQFQSKFGPNSPKTKKVVKNWKFNYLIFCNNENPDQIVNDIFIGQPIFPFH